MENTHTRSDVVGPGSPPVEPDVVPDLRERPPVPRGLLAGVAVLLVLGGAGAIVRAPLHSIGPGPARDVLDMIQIRGAETHPSAGELLLTTATVSGAPLNLWEVLWVWIDPGVGTTARHNVVQPGVTDDEQSARNVFDMERSKLSAELAAFEALGTPATRITGARVISLIEGGPSDGVLEPRDVLIEVRGRAVEGPGDVVDALEGTSVGSTAEVVFRRDGEQRAATITTGAALDDPDRAVIGVFLGEAYRLPHEVEIDTQRIGGPSGGLVFALSIVDVLTPEDLTRGHIIAATGTIEVERGADGSARIGVIGAVREKVQGAEAAGATVFVLPADEAEEARALAPQGMIVLGVETLRDAIAQLEALAPREAPGATGERAAGGSA